MKTGDTTKISRIDALKCVSTELDNASDSLATYGALALYKFDLIDLLIFTDKMQQPEVY